MEGDNLLKGMSLLREVNNASCSTERIPKAEQLCNLVNDIGQPGWSECLNFSLFIDELNKLLSNSLVPEFIDRDFTSYDKSDFKDYDVLTNKVLEFIVKIIPHFEMGKQSVNLESQRTCCTPHNSLGVTDDAGQHDEDQCVSSRIRSENLLKILPNLLLLIAGNIRNPVWSSQECQASSEHILNNFDDLLPDHNLHDILVNTNFLQSQMTVPKLGEKNILGYLFHQLEKPLARNRWEKNPFLCEVFSWLVVQVKSPNLSSHIDQIMATSLNFIHSHEVGNKMNGLHTLIHLISNVSGEELRWYNRADVIFETVKNQMYSKVECVLDAVLQCLFLLLKVLERSSSEKSDKHHEIMASLLRNAEMENLLVIRRILISYVACYILDYGILCIQHLSKALQVIEMFLEVEDSTQETARIQALQALENIIIVAWPRIYPQSQHILQFLLKFMVNIYSTNFEEEKSLDVKEIFVAKVHICVKLLLKVNPALNSCLEEIEQSDQLLMLKDFCNECIGTR